MNQADINVKAEELMENKLDGTNDKQNANQINQNPMKGNDNMMANNMQQNMPTDFQNNQTKKNMGFDMNQGGMPNNMNSSQNPMECKFLCLK